jgi:hypothetical protein
VKAVSFGLAASLLLSAAVVHADNKRISIPSDFKAKYFVVDKGWLGGERTIVTKRIAREGTSFTKRVYNCEKGTVKSLGESESLETLADAVADAVMGPIVPESTSYYISLEACKYLRDS